MSASFLRKTGSTFSHDALMGELAEERHDGGNPCQPGADDPADEPSPAVLQTGDPATDGGIHLLDLFAGHEVDGLLVHLLRQVAHVTGEILELRSQLAPELRE